MIINYFLTLIATLLICGLALDVGLLGIRRIQLQNAADAAALGAMYEFNRNNSSWQTAGKSEAAANGFADGSNGVVVSLANPPTTGAFTNNYGSIQAIVTQTVNTIFMGLIGGKTATIAARAVALEPPCAWFMSNSSSYQTLQGASAGMNAYCPVYVNRSLTVDGFAHLNCWAIYIASSSTNSSISGGIFPTPPYYNSLTQTDPLAGITSPVFTTPCTFSSTLSISSTTTLNPGTYCGGINITSATVTFNPGLYIITGGGTWSGATVQGTGVTLFFTKGGGYNYGQLSIKSSSSITLSAPTDASHGGIPGILIFGDRNWVPTTNQDFKVDTSSVNGDGIWYTTNSGIYNWRTNMTGTNYFAIVTDNMYYYGCTVTPLTNFSSVAGGNPFRKYGGLVE